MLSSVSEVEDAHFHLSSVGSSQPKAQSPRENASQTAALLLQKAKAQVAQQLNELEESRDKMHSVAVGLLAVPSDVRQDLKFKAEQFMQVGMGRDEGKEDVNQGRYLVDYHNAQNNHCQQQNGVQKPQVHEQSVRRHSPIGAARGGGGARAGSPLCTLNPHARDASPPSRHSYSLMLHSAAVVDDDHHQQQQQNEAQKGSDQQPEQTYSASSRIDECYSAFINIQNVTKEHPLRRTYSSVDLTKVQRDLRDGIAHAATDLEAEQALFKKRLVQVSGSSFSCFQVRFRGSGKSTHQHLTIGAGIMKVISLQIGITKVIPLPIYTMFLL